MTGICGWLGAVPAGPAEATLASMTRALPPASGQVTESLAQPQAAVAISGWADSVSLHHEDGIVAALIGEAEWSDPEIAALARAHGHGRALVAAYRKHRNDLFRHLHGPFCVAVLCPAEATALLAIDRIGIHGLCYTTVQGGGIVFGTTTDAVNVHPATTATVTPQTVFDFLQFYVCPAPTTIYREQSKLPIAHYLSVDGGTARPRPYWDMPYGNVAEGAPEALSAALHDHLRSAIRKVVGPETVGHTGAFLSGGLDSSTVCGLLSELSDGPARSFTIAFEEPRYDESGYAKICARHFGLDPHFYTLTMGDAGSFIPKLAETYDEPFGNSSAIPAYYCARTAVECGVTQLLAGDGGDELFAGNERYVEQNVYEKYTALPAALRRNFLSPAIRAFGGIGGIGLLSRAANYVRMADIPLPHRLYARNPLVSGNGAELFSRDAMVEIDTVRWKRLLDGSYDAAGTGSRVQRMMRLDLQITLADNDLRKVTRTCELAGCRVRFPLLDEKLLEFAARLPAGTLLEGGRLRGFYKRAMTGFLPVEILEKKKHGFGMPFGTWTHESPAISELICDSLGSLAVRGIFNPATIHEMVDDHCKGRPNPWHDVMWDMMMLELWWQSRDGARVAVPRLSGAAAS